MSKKILLSLIVLLSSVNMSFALDKNEMLQLQTLVSKFSLTMLGLVVFSFVIFIGLTLYNKFWGNGKIQTYELKKYSLRPPKDVDEAIYMFIEKNRLV